MNDVENDHVEIIVLQVLQVLVEQVRTCAKYLFLLVRLTEMSPESNLSPGRELTHVPIVMTGQKIREVEHKITISSSMKVKFQQVILKNKKSDKTFAQVQIRTGMIVLRKRIFPQDT